MRSLNYNSVYFQPAMILTPTHVLLHSQINLEELTKLNFRHYMNGEKKKFVTLSHTDGSLD